MANFGVDVDALLPPPGGIQPVADGLACFRRAQGSALQFFYTLPVNYSVGTTRPTAAPVGWLHFDTTINRPVWSDGAGNWSDPFGTITGEQVLAPTAYGLTATGVSLTDALLIGAYENVLTNVPSGTGVRLPPVNPGRRILIAHASFGGSDMSVYPPDTSSTINGYGGGVPIIIPAPIIANSVPSSEFLIFGTVSPFTIISL